MIFLDKVKNMRIYKTQLYLPTLVDDKKKGSLIFLLTPNYNSSNQLMNNPLLVNRLRYESYYIEKSLSYYIDGKAIVDDEIDVDEVTEAYNYITESMTASERNKLPDSAFGVPSKRKFPLDTEAHVRSAIKFFNYVDEEDEAELARRIIAAMKKFNITDVKVSERNRFSKYYKSKEATNESVRVGNWDECTCFVCGKKSDHMARVQYRGLAEAYVCPQCQSTNKFTLIKEDVMATNEFLSLLPESSYIKLDDHIILTEDVNTKYDERIRRLLYKQRLRTRKDVLLLLDTVKKDNKWIKYAFPDIKRYYGRNMFVDLYYYMNIFLQNNKWAAKRGFDLFYDFLNRLLNASIYESNNYKKKTIFIPIEDWNRFHDDNIWNFRVNINPISITYHLMFTENITLLKKLYKKCDVVFFGKNCFFKFDVNALNDNNIKGLALKFRNFTTKISTNSPIEQEDIDTSFDNDLDKDVIKANVIDNIEKINRVDLTPQVALINKMREKPANKEEKLDSMVPKSYTTQTKGAVDKLDKINKELDRKETIEPVKLSKLAKNDTKFMNKQAAANNNKLNLAKKIVNAVDNNDASEEEVLDDIEYDDIRNIDDKSLIDLASGIDIELDPDQIDPARAKRMEELDKATEEIVIKGKTVKEIIEEDDEEIPVTSLDIASPNEDWKNLTFMNFDKKYNIDKDILNCFLHLSTCSQKLSIRDIQVENTSTSEDRIETYTVKYEDMSGKRYTVKLDIPIMEDNRFLLRGYSKTIQNQLINMPILKTDVNSAQIISNYMKIFVYRMGDSQGRSTALSSRFIKAALKYKGTDIKITGGNARKTSAKYELPIDYIAISSFIVKMETSDFILYFNQDDIYNEYTVEQGLGVPYMYDKKTKSLVYYDDNKIDIPFAQYLIDNVFIQNPKYEAFVEMFMKATAPSTCAYSSCSLLNSRIPTAILCGYYVGLRKTMDAAGIKYTIVDKLTADIKKDISLDWVKFADGYIVYTNTYYASLLMNGLKASNIDQFSVTDIDNKGTYLTLLDDYGGRIKADGLDNFYDLMMDPITVEVCKHYGFPTDFISALLYANSLLSDNKFFKHTNMVSRRIRHYELIAVYTYKVLADAYSSYSSQKKHRSTADLFVKRSAVVDMFLTDTITSDDSCINALRDVETNNGVTTKGPSGMNSDRAYSLDKRTYDDSMTNILGMSTGFASNVGINRQTTIDSSIEGDRGYVIGNNGNTDNFSAAKTLTATEAMTPFGYSRDDPMRTAMTFIQTSKHMVITKDSDPLLVTNGADEALVYLTSNQFAFKAKQNGTIEEITSEYIVVKYEDGTYDYVNLTENLKKNSDGGYYVPLKLEPIEGLSKGMKISANQVLAYDKLSFSNSVGETDNLAYNIGKLTKVAVLNTDDNFEDSGIVTESLSRSLTTPIVLKEERVLEKDAYIYEIAKVGQHVEVGDNLLVWKDNYEDEDTRALLKSLSQDEVSELGKKKITSPVTGTLQGIKMYRTVELTELSESLQEVVSKYEEKYDKLAKKLEKYNIDKSNIPAHYALGTTGKLKKAEDAVYVEFFIEFEDTVGIGDKIVMMSANKQVISRLIPDEVAPYTDFRPNEHIDAIVSEVSISKRMVQSIAVYGSLQKLMVELDRKVKDIMGIPYDDSKV